MIGAMTTGHTIKAELLQTGDSLMSTGSRADRTIKWARDGVAMTDSGVLLDLRGTTVTLRGTGRCECDDPEYCTRPATTRRLP